jgi:hypothetical protein
LWVIKYISRYFRTATDKIAFWSEIHKNVLIYTELTSDTVGGFCC